MTTTDYEAIAGRLATINNQLAQLKEEKEGLVALILANLQPGTKTQAGNYTIGISRASETINAKRLTETFPFAEHPDLYKVTLDTQKVKAKIAHDDLKKLGAFDTKTPSVTVK